jgi:hypothetical protein
MEEMKSYTQFKRITTAGAIISGVAVFVLMLFIVLDVVLRNMGGASIPGGFEIVENYLLPLIEFPSLAWVCGSGIMPNMDLLLPRMSPATRRRTVQSIVVVEILVIGVVFVAAAVFAVWHVMHQTSFLAGLTMLPEWPAQLLAPIGLGLVVVECCFVFAANRKREDPGFTVGRGPAEVVPEGI